MNDTESLTVPSGDLQRKTREVLNAVRAGQHVHITRYGEREAVIVDPKFYKEALAALATHPTTLHNG